MRIPPPPRPGTLVLSLALVAVPAGRLPAQAPGFAALPALATPAAPGPALRVGKLPGTLEVGAGAGSVSTSRWYGIDPECEPGTVEDGTAVSLEARYFPVPWVGLRLQAGRFDGRIRTQPGPAHTGYLSRPPQPLRGITFDASAMVRPLVSSGVPAPLSTVYAFAGAGGVRLRLSGQPDIVVTCEDDLDCMTRVPVGGTVLQVTTGVGADLLRVGRVAIFAEASRHSYRPRFEVPETVDPSYGPRFGVELGPTAPAEWVVGGPQTPATLERVVTRRFAAGARVTLGRPARIPPPPSPPPGLVGGWLELRTAQPGAEVYLIPRTVLEDDPGLLCRLRADVVRAPWFRGRTVQTGALRTAVDPMTMVLVVRQNGREHQERVQLVRGQTQQRVLDMRVDGTPYRCPP